MWLSDGGGDCVGVGLLRLFTVTSYYFFPTCQENGQIYLSIDGNFGLCRKQAAGASVRGPLCKEGFFMDQKEIDTFVENYGSLRLSLQKVEFF